MLCILLVFFVAVVAFDCFSSAFGFSCCRVFATNLFACLIIVVVVVVSCLFTYNITCCVFGCV